LQNANNAVIRSLFRKLQFAGAAVTKDGQFYTDSLFVVDALAEVYCQLSDLTAVALPGTFVVARDWLQSFTFIGERNDQVCSSSSRRGGYLLERKKSESV
jgi:hypothetical protein